MMRRDRGLSKSSLAVLISIAIFWLPEPVLAVPQIASPTNLGIPQPAPNIQPGLILENGPTFTAPLMCTPCPLQGQWVVTRRNVGTRNIYIAPEDDIWLVSARGDQAQGILTCTPGLQFSQLQCGTFQPRQQRDLNACYLADQSKSTMIYVHGNRTDLEYAKSRALQMYENLFGKLSPEGCIKDRPPIRLVIFAWKAESEINRILPDFKLKSDRAYLVADSFRELLKKLPDQNPILLGYSLGAQIVLKGVQDSGLIEGRQGKYRIVLIAASLNPKFVESELPCLPAIPTIESTTIFLNRNDFAIKTSNRILNSNNEHHDPLELVTSSQDSPNKINMIDITRETSRCHSIVKYTDESTTIQAVVRDLVAARGKRKTKK